MGVVKQVLTRAVIRAFSMEEGGVQPRESLERETYSRRDPTMSRQGGVWLSEKDQTLADGRPLKEA